MQKKIPFEPKYATISADTFMQHGDKFYLIKIGFLYIEIIRYI